jgi:hypothetical protein
MMKIIELKKYDDIWFVPPNSEISYPAIVDELHYNDGEPYAYVKVGEYQIKIDDSYTIALGERVSK